MGKIIPAVVNTAPLLIIPFLPFIINNPVMDISTSEPAKKSENHVHNCLGLF
jgi:hypothetical protein